jgi:hypothetical protein
VSGTAQPAAIFSVSQQVLEFYFLQGGEVSQLNPKTLRVVRQINPRAIIRWICADSVNVQKVKDSCAAKLPPVTNTRHCHRRQQYIVAYRLLRMSLQHRPVQ